MKYIVVKLGGKEHIFVFPKTIDHDRMHEAVSALRLGDRHNWRREWPEPVSAGFVEGGRCVGRSETMNLDSRGELDTILLRA
jgi:hypothetical protein